MTPLKYLTEYKLDMFYVNNYIDKSSKWVEINRLYAIRTVMQYDILPHKQVHFLLSAQKYIM